METLLIVIALVVMFILIGPDNDGSCRGSSKRKAPPTQAKLTVGEWWAIVKKSCTYN